MFDAQTATQRELLELIRTGRPHPAADRDRVYQLALRNRLANVVARLYAGAVGWDNLPSDWQTSYHEAERKICAYLDELERIATLAADAGQILIVLENGAIARAGYAPPGDFVFGDFDLLTPPTALESIHTLLLSAGYRLLDGPQQVGSAMLDGRLEYERQLESGHRLRLNVQPRLVARRWFNDAAREPDASALVARSTIVPGSIVRVLSPVDTLFQVAVHNASHGFVRKPGLVLHLDVDRIVRAGPVDWERFVAQVQALQVQTAVYFALRIPHDLFDTPVPERVLAAIRPSPWKERLLAGWIRRAGLFNPDAPKFSRADYILFTALLYDDLAGLWRGIFPNAAWMRRRYHVKNRLLLPLYHVRRLTDLMLRHLL